MLNVFMVINTMLFMHTPVSHCVVQLHNRKVQHKII